jgi:hypothetical protein
VTIRTKLGLKLFFQPSVHLPAKFQGFETNSGFQGDKVDKLFLDGIGLQVDSILVKVGSLGDVGNFVNRRA